MGKLEEILCEVFSLKSDELTDNLAMEDIQVCDSLTHMDLVASIEEGLDIQLSMNDIMKMKDVKAIKSVVSEKLV